MLNYHERRLYIIGMIRDDKKSWHKILQWYLRYIVKQHSNILLYKSLK